MVIPDRGRGGVWQRSVSRRAVRRAVTAGAAAAVVVLGLVILPFVAVPRAVEGERLADENAALRQRLALMERKVGEMEPLLQRVRAYDDQLRELAERQALPGFGPLDAEEAEARRRWIEGVAPRLPTPPAPEGSDELEVALARVHARLAAVDDDLDVLAGRMDDVDELIARWEQSADVLPRIWPVESAVLTSPFGWRESPYGPGWKFHGGIDLGVPMGTPILAVNDGLVTFSGWDGGHGNTVDIDHGGGVSTRYCHASRLLVAAGDQVQTGDLVALAGSTGVSTGPHLHFELFFEGEKVDPLPYLP